MALYLSSSALTGGTRIRIGCIITSLIVLMFASSPTMLGQTMTSGPPGKQRSTLLMSAKIPLRDDSLGSVRRNLRPTGAFGVARPETSTALSGFWVTSHPLLWN